MRRKRSNQVPITLFSFQDIITSVTAILLLLTLLLAFELVQKAAMARATQPKQVAERVTESLQEIEAQLLELQSKLATQGKVASELAKSEKPEIQQHHRRRGQRELADGGGPVARQDHLVVLCQRPLHLRADVFIVIDDQQLLLH